MKAKKNYSNFNNSLKNNIHASDIEKNEYESNNIISEINNKKIIELCSKKLLKNPNNKRALLLRASIYIKINKYEEAKNDLQSLLTDPNLASTAYYLLGIINKEINNNELALIYFTKSIQLDDNNINAYFLRGAVNNILGNYNNAIKDYNYAIYKDTLNTDGKNIYKNISKIFAQTLYEQKNNSKKKQRKNSLINKRNTNYSLDKFQINYNSQKKKNKGRCLSEENDSKKIHYSNYKNLFKNAIKEEDLPKNHKNKFYIVNPSSNNFNFFIRNITNIKINEKYNDTYSLLKEINGYLNEEDNNERLCNNLQPFKTNEEQYKCKNNDIIHKSISIRENDGIKANYNQNFSSSLLTNKTCNTSNEYMKTSNKSYSPFHFQNNSIDEQNSKSNINNQKSRFYYNNNISISDTGTNNHNLSNSQIINNNVNIHLIEKEDKIKSNNKKNIIQNYNISIINNNDNNNNYDVDKNKNSQNELLMNTPLYESTKTFCNYSNDFKNSINLRSEYNFDNENLPEDEILCIKGEIERSQGNYNEAIDLFTKAIQLNSNSFKAFFNRAFTFDKIGLYNQSINDYTSSINIRQNNSFCYYNRGITYNKIGNYEKSIHDFSKAIEIEPNKPEFFFNRACLYKNTKQYQNAINDYTVVIKLFPKLYTPVYNRGICYEKLKLYQSSIKDFETCIQMSKNNIHPYYHLATVYKILNKYDISMNYLKQLIDIKPDYSPAYHDIGVILTQLEDYEKAIQYFNKSIELDNKKPIYYHNRGWAYRKISPENAINDMNMAISLDNNNPRFYFNRASIYKDEKIFDKAIEDYSVIILKFDNKNYDSYFNRAFCFNQINDYYDAINDYTKVLELKNDDFESLCNRADLYIKINNYFLAIEDLNRIIKIRPNNKSAYIKRAKCYEIIKNIKQSCNDYERALFLTGKKANYN